MNDLHVLTMINCLKLSSDVVVSILTNITLNIKLPLIKFMKKNYFLNKINLYEQLLEIYNGLRFVTKNTFVKNIYK